MRARRGGFAVESAPGRVRARARCRDAGELLLGTAVLWVGSSAPPTRARRCAARCVRLAVSHRAARSGSVRLGAAGRAQRSPSPLREDRRGIAVRWSPPNRANRENLAVTRAAFACLARFIRWLLVSFLACFFAGYSHLGFYVFFGPPSAMVLPTCRINRAIRGFVVSFVATMMRLARFCAIDRHRI